MERDQEMRTTKGCCKESIYQRQHSPETGQACSSCTDCIQLRFIDAYVCAFKHFASENERVILCSTGSSFALPANEMPPLCASTLTA